MAVEIPEGFDAAVDTLGRAQSSGDLGLLNEAIGVLSRIRAEVAEDHPYRYRVLGNLSQALRQRFDLCGERDDLEAAIVAAESSLRLMPPSDPRRPVVQTNLSVLRQSGFIHYGVREGLGVAVELAAAAVRQTDVTDRRWPDRAHALAAAQRLQYEATGSLRYLEEAIDTARKAFASAGEDRPYLPSHLALTLRLRYERTGSIADLNEAIEVGRRAAASSDPAHSPMTWGNLSTTLEARYTHVGDSRDLDEAIEWARRAVAATAPEHTHHPMFLAILSRVLDVRGRRSANRIDLDEAVEAADRAVVLTHDSGPSHAGRLSLLTSVLLSREKVGGRSDDLDRAVKMGCLAARATRQTEHPRAEILLNAATALRRRFERTGALDDRDEALWYALEALATAGENNPDRILICLSLGEWYVDRDPTAAGRHYRAGAEQAGAPPSLRCLSARRWAQSAAAAGHMAQAVEAYRTAIELLPRTASRALTRADQERQLERQVGLASDAAATALRHQLPDVALSLLEYGRGVLLAQELETRSDLTELRRHHPELARSVTELAARMDTMQAAALDAGEPPSLVEPADLGHQLAEDWQRQVDTIRARPGFEHFLSPPTEAELASVADGGVVVAVNVSGIGCDALALWPGVPVRRIRLPKLSLSDLTARTRQFTDAVGHGRGRDDSCQLRNVLAWLWRTVAEPVLDELGIGVPPDRDTVCPRLWWLPTGLLTALPLHAASAYDGDRPIPGHSVLDRVVASYTPTLRSLHEARQRPAWRWPPRRPAVIAVPDVSGELPLFDAVDEAEMVAAALSVPPPLVAPGCTYRGLIADADWAHLVCHAFNDISSPSRSHLVLPDGNLSVPEIAALGPQDAHLAYLSACASAYGGQTLTDEAVHLSSAFQLAGYTHVIGTLWHVHDAPAAEFAQVLYRLLPETRDVATAMHKTTLTMRERYLEAPDMWASHVHIGP